MPEQQAGYGQKIKTTLSPSGTNYPTGTYEPLDGPNAYTTSAGPVGVIAGQLFNAGKSLWNQTQYGMNNEVKNNYLKILDDPANAGKTVEDMVNAARSQYFADNPNANLDPRNGATGGIEYPVGSGNYVSTDDNKINLGTGGNNGAFTGTTNGANMANTVNDSGWLSQQYQNLLGRDIGDAGLDFYTSELASGNKTREQIIADLNYSAEGQGYTTQAEADKFSTQAATGSVARDINAAYVNEFGRNMGQEGLDFYENRFATDPTYTPEQFKAELAASDEGQGYTTQAEAAANPALTASGTGAIAGPNLLDNIQAQLAQYVAQGGDGASTGTAGTAGETANLSAIQELLNSYQAETGGAAIPSGLTSTGGNFKPVTFRSGTGQSALTPQGMATQLAEPYANISDMVGQGQGLFGQASTLAQQAPDQFNYNFDPEGRATELFNQRSALLEPSFAQQNARAREGMFGTGRLGLRLSGEGLGAGSGSQMMQPDALGVSNAQSQALAGLAQQSTNDAYNQQMQQAGLDLNQFNTNQMTNQQQYANLMGTGAGMFSGGLQAPKLEAQLAGAPLQSEALRQNYELGLLGQETSRITGQAQANQANYQPDPWLTGLTGLGTAFLGSAGGSGWLSDGFSKGGWFS